MAEQVFYEIARWRLDEQLAQIRELNGRLMGVFAGATALLVLFGALQDLEGLRASGLAVGFASTSIGVYVALLITALIGYRDADLLEGPSLTRLQGLNRTESDLRLAVAISIFDSVGGNEGLIRRKSQLVFATLSFWALDAILLLAAALTSVSYVE